MSFVAEPPEGPSLAEQAAGRSTAHLVAARADEALRLMDAATEVMARHGTRQRATVAEIVEVAGLSNQAFYRHFAGKDDLVAAIVDAGARRLVGYVAHRMEAFANDPVAQVREWTRAVLSQGTDPKVAEPTRAIAWNRNALAVDREAAARRAESMVWALLEAPVAALGSARPREDAYLIGQLVFAVLAEVLGSDEATTLDELEFVGDFCVAAVT
jgi:AcrR family transcriptional regulator